MNNFLLDTDFLTRLDKENNKEVWAKVIALDINENQLEEITGRITSGGSINIDGTSAIRRSCSFSMTSKDVDINAFYWGLHTKFKLFMGLTNRIDSKYPEIVWFPQGTYVITSFNSSQSANSFNISIQGKDKMCLLNGEIGGVLTAPIDFGKLEERDEEGNLTITDIPIKDIIREAVHEYAKEPWHNIVVNDLEDLGVELLEYKGSRPLYMLIDESTGEVTNITMNPDFKLYDKEKNEKTISEFETMDFNALNEFYQGSSSGYFVGYMKQMPSDQDHLFSIAKIEYGQTAGYRLTDITYPGDLIANQGDSLTSVLDKLTQMLGQFEYFYDLDGRFIFQKKKTYVQTTWNNLLETEDGEVITDTASTPYSYNFKDNQLAVSFSNNPNITNLKNDFSIWGVRNSATGAEIPIHLRYAIDKKPQIYISFGISEDEANEYNKIFSPLKPLEPRSSVEYNTNDWDWRELIYQMAKDYRKFNHWDRFLNKVDNANIVEGKHLYPNGYTGYEQYYIDLEGFWRQLYNPNFMIDDKKLNMGGDGPIETEIELNEFGTFNGVSIDDVYIYPIKPFTKDNIKETIKKEVEEGEDVLDKETSLPILKHTPENSLYLDTGKTPYTVQEFVKTVVLDDSSGIQYYLKYTKDTEPKEIDNTVASVTPITSILVKKNKVENASDNWIWEMVEKELDGKFSKQWIIDEKYMRLVDYEYIFNLLNSYNPIALYYQSDKTEKISDLKGIDYKELYFKDVNNNILWPSYFTEEKVKDSDETYLSQKKIQYYYTTYNYYGEEAEGDKKYWHKNIWEAPELLNFWFDLMDTHGKISDYAVSVIGNRPKVVNDTSVKSIYFRKTPTVIFINKSNQLGWEFTERKSGYTYIHLPDQMLSLFTMSGQGKSAWNTLEECLYNDVCCVESVSLTTIPIYYLQPNTKIYIEDQNSKVDGEYIVSRFTIPLNYNGTMSISANKVAEKIY